MNHLSSRKVLCLFIQIGFLFDATTSFLDHLVFKRPLILVHPGSSKRHVWLVEGVCTSWPSFFAFT